MHTEEYRTMPAGHRLFIGTFSAEKPRAQLVLAHGIGEHSGRYREIAPRFAGLGLNVIAYDHYGHGRSDGARGTLDTDTRLDDDLAVILAQTKAAHSDLPLIAFGHSMGGAVTAGRIAQRDPSADYCILSSPALAPSAPAAAKLGTAVMYRLAPDFAIRHFLSLKVSHRPEKMRELKEDPLCHKTISGRLARAILTAGGTARKNAQNWPVPTLLLYAGADKLVSPSACRQFAENTPAHVQSQCFSGYYHEIFNETDPEPVYARLAAWLNEQLGTPALY